MAGLTRAQVEQFNHQGFLVIEGVIDEQTLTSVEFEYAMLLDREINELFAEGRLASSFSGLPFGDRYVAALGQEPALFERINISLPLRNQDFPVDAKVHTGPAVYRMLTHTDLLDIVESLIGPEICSNPVQHVRIKPPKCSVPDALSELSYVGKTTWHQDMGALMDEANDTEVVTAWIAVTDASEENGCLRAIPGSHKSGELTAHCPGKGVAAENYIPPKLLNTQGGRVRPMPLPVNRGGIVLFNRYTQHSALPNRTDSIRWSFDLRYHPIGQPSGRPAFPSFIARSRQNPAHVMRSSAQWTEIWQQARYRIIRGQYSAPIFNAERWVTHADSPICA